MNGNGTARTALVVEASPRWRALLGELLREQGWTVFAAPALAEPADTAGPAYHLAVVGTADEAAALLERDSRVRCVLLAAQAGELPAGLRAHPRLLRTLAKSAFTPEALLRLLGPAAAPNGHGTPSVAAEDAPKVLVVEDDPQWRAIYEEMLAEAGYSPYFAVSYGEARGWLQRLAFALAVVDLNLASSAAPEGNRDGFYLLRAASQRKVPAIVVSALGDPQDIDRAYDEFGIFAFVEKEGFDRRNFLRLLAEAVQAHEADSAPDEPAAGPPAEAAPAAGLGALTPREREVLRLVVQGYTNRQIAEALLISSNTTKKHVDHILQKLGVSTRAAAAALGAVGNL